MRNAVAERGTFNLIHTALVLKVDCVVRKDSEYRREEFRRRRRVPRSTSSRCSLVAPEDLIISKLDWARESRSEVQLTDVRNLLASVELDRALPGAVGTRPRSARPSPRGSGPLPPAIERRVSSGCSSIAHAGSGSWRLDVLRPSRRRPGSGRRTWHPSQRQRRPAGAGGSSDLLRVSAPRSASGSGGLELGRGVTVPGRPAPRDRCGRRRGRPRVPSRWR